MSKTAGLEKVYVPFNTDLSKIKLKRSIVIIRELYAKKNTLIEAKKQKCDFILNKNGKLKKIN